jgi:hypothetical protein
MIFINSIRSNSTSNLIQQCKSRIKFNVKIFYRNLFQLAIDGPAASGKSYYLCKF